MPCYTPLKAWALKGVKSATGKKVISFSNKFSSANALREPIQLPCGQCFGCRISRAKQWAVRCWHESKLHDNNCFITLTFNDESVSASGSLDKCDFQKFMKRLRIRFADDVLRKTGKSIRYFHVGEYGEKLGRPHHHACLFNFDFPDKVLWDTRDGIRLYRSKVLEELWPVGFSTIGEVSFESAAYVARYCVTKITGKQADSHYDGKLPEYNSMSLKPAIGLDWFREFAETDVFPQDFIVLDDGFKTKVPKFYDRCYELTNPDTFGVIKSFRIDKAKKNPDNSPERLKVRHEVAKNVYKTCVRKLKEY